MKDNGFTLVEVLAALMVFSIAIIGLTKAGTESVRGVTMLDQKMLASVVADNQLVVSRGQEINSGVRTGQSEQMSQRFDYRVETTATDTPNFYTLKVDVMRENDSQVLISRTTFRSK